MAVLIEGISIVIRRKTIDEKYPGGWDGFVEDAPNRTLCADDKIARLGFMDPNDAESYIKGLEKIGFKYIVDGKTSEIAVIDQTRGFMADCNWLEAGRVEMADDTKHIFTACILKGCKSKQLIFPHGWKYEESLSCHYGFIPSGHLEKSLKYLRHENGLDVYYNKLTDQEVYIGRTGEMIRHKKIKLGGKL